MSRNNTRVFERKRNLIRYRTFIEKPQASLSLPCSLCVFRLGWNGFSRKRSSFSSTRRVICFGSRAADLRNFLEYSMPMSLPLEDFDRFSKRIRAYRFPFAVFFESLHYERIKVFSRFSHKVMGGNRRGEESLIFLHGQNDDTSLLCNC